MRECIPHIPPPLNPPLQMGMSNEFKSLNFSCSVCVQNFFKNSHLINKLALVDPGGKGAKTSLNFSYRYLLIHRYLDSCNKQNYQSEHFFIFNHPKLFGSAPNRLVFMIKKTTQYFRDVGINILAVGVGDNYQYNQLVDITGSESNVFEVTDYNNLTRSRINF